MSNIPSGTAKAWNGVLYIVDTRGSSSKRGIRIKKGDKLPSKGLTIASENPVYIHGNFNTGGDGPPSNSGNPTDPEDGSYNRVPASIMGDSITLLSKNWDDSKSSYNMTEPEKVAANTTVNAALIAGNVPTDGVFYSGGGQNFVRFLENWTNKTFTYYGSMLGLYASKQAIGKWGITDYYRPPKQNWFFDPQLTVSSEGEAVSVPGYVSTVSYLQQQRWYLQY